MNSLKALLGATLLLALAFSGEHLGAQDGHIDPSPNARKFDLTFARHPATTFSFSKASSGLAYATRAMQICNSRVADDQDVAAAIALNAAGPLRTFGELEDGLDIVTTPEEIQAVLASSAAYVKVVTMISFCGSSGSGIVGCAPPGTSMAVISGLSTNDFGETVAHELGHNVGLHHRESPGNPLMKASGFGGNELNLSELASYHARGSSDGTARSTDIAFVVDDTGSMGEEIAGVRNSLSAYISGIQSSACKAFQLTTFKDTPSQRDPTTDTTVIASQVSGLTATGGGDCPEASDSALALALTKVKNTGRIFLATDASPRNSLASSISSARARGVRIDVILSGDCVAAPGAMRSENSPGNTADALGALSAIDEHFRLANETGGVFAFIPEVNTGGASGVGAARYRASSLNIINGLDGATLVVSNPGSVPIGSMVDVSIQGSGTNFQPSTGLTIEGGGVSVLAVRVVSPVQLIATLDVAAGTPQGFRGAVATTGTEVARGVDVVHLGAPASAPQVISVSPSTITVGQVTLLTIRGARTSFSSSSIVGLGTGITVGSVTAVSPSELTVGVTVAATASVGFRDVIVRTGSEVAAETMTGPLFVAPIASTGIPAIASVQPAQLSRGQTSTIVITGSTTSFAPGISEVTFSGSGIDVISTAVESATRIAANVSVAGDAALGFRDIRVTTGAEVAVLVNGMLVSQDIGPSLVPPSVGITPGSTTAMPLGNVGELVTRAIQYTSVGGTPGQSSQLVCTTAGAVEAVSGTNQTVSTGTNPVPVVIGIRLGTSSRSGSVTCNGSTFNFTATAGAIAQEVPSGGLLFVLITVCLLALVGMASIRRS